MYGGRGVAVGLCSLALVGSSLMWAPATQAQALITCVGEERTSYTPGLSLTARQTAIRAQATYTCTGDPKPADPKPAGSQAADSKAAGSKAAGSRPTGPRSTGHVEAVSPSASCLAVNSPKAKELVRYGDGATSRIDYDSAVAARVGGVNVVTFTGRVVEGRGKGGTAIRSVQVLPSAAPTECLSSTGVREARGPVELQILPAGGA
ncbi:hypothetical protein [Streptomyces sp. URMC 123]|uniref:hypothetical protein n=1 Tax=Streptomyces sp. URMC 123 TaxID=3423403 RepID=UPI003F1E2D88